MVVLSEQVHTRVEASELDAGEVKAREVEVLGYAGPGTVLDRCERLGFSGTEHVDTINTAVKPREWSSRGASRERYLAHRISARAGIVTGRS